MSKAKPFGILLTEIKRIVREKKNSKAYPRIDLAHSLESVSKNFNRQLRKVTKTKSAFVSDDALLKQIYLVTMQIIDKWTMPIRDWGNILMHLMIYFGDRVNVKV